MDNRDRRTFYLIEGSAWVLLSLFFAMVAHRTTHQAIQLLDLECWFAMFPVAWTIALLWAWNREWLRLFFGSKVGKSSLSAFSWTLIGLMRITDHQITSRIMGVLLLILGAAATGATLHQWRKERKAAANPTS